MKNKTLEFIKNGAIATIPFVAGGIGGAELADLVTDSEPIINATSLVIQYATGYASFMALQAYDNKEDYMQDDKWDYKKLVKGTLKTVFSLGLAEIPYILIRSGSMDYFLNKDFSPTESSLLADAIALPLFFLFAIPLAKKTGLIKKVEDPKR